MITHQINNTTNTKTINITINIDDRINSEVMPKHKTYRGNNLHSCIFTICQAGTAEIFASSNYVTKMTKLQLDILQMSYI